MINLNKKIVGIISFASASTIGVATTLSTIALTKDNEIISQEDANEYPLNRKSGYSKYSINETLINNTNIDQLVTVINDGNNYLYVISEDVFIRNFEAIVRETFSSISKFSSNANNYVIETNYLIENNHTIKIDLV